MFMQIFIVGLFFALAWRHSRQKAVAPTLFIVTTIERGPVNDDFLFCDQCGSRVAMWSRNALTGKLCWFGRDHESVEIGEQPSRFSWTCSCGRVTEIEDSVPAPAAKESARILQFDPTRRKGRKRHAGD